jgi:hypothetical protein
LAARISLHRRGIDFPWHRGTDFPAAPRQWGHDGVVGSHTQGEPDDERGRGDQRDPDGRAHDGDRDAAELHDAELDDAELVDDSWEDGRTGGRGALRWLFLLVIPVVALVVLQLQPDQEHSATRVPSPTSSSTGSRLETPSTWPPRMRANLARPGEDRWPARGKVTVTAVGHPLLAIRGDWELFALADDAVVRIQPARGRVTTTRFPALDPAGPVSFLVTGHGALVATPMSFVPGYLEPDGRAAREIPATLRGHSQVVPGPDADHVWVKAVDDTGSFMIRLLGLDGRPVGQDVPAPPNMRDPMLPDGSGHPCIWTTGGIYDVTDHGLDRITTGTLQAVGPTRWLVVECDDHDGCARVVIDKRTGARRTLPGSPLDYFAAGGVISPDGDTAAVFDPNESGMLLLDLGSGGSWRVPVRVGGQNLTGEVSAAWSPDSRWLFLTEDDGTLVAWDSSTGRLHHLGVDLPSVRKIAVRSPG